MKAHEIIKQLLLADANIVDRVGAKVFHISIPQKVKLPAVVFKTRQTPSRTKDGIHSFRIAVEVFGMEEKGNTITDFQDEIINALEGSEIASESMSKFLLIDTTATIDDDFNNFYTLNNFEFDLNI